MSLDAALNDTRADDFAVVQQILSYTLLILATGKSLGSAPTMYFCAEEALVQQLDMGDFTGDLISRLLPSKWRL